MTCPAPTTRPAAADLWRCTGPLCRAACAGHELLAYGATSTTRGDLCPDCWPLAGRPGRPGPAPTVTQIWEREQVARERQARASGAYRHLVRKGRA